LAFLFWSFGLLGPEDFQIIWLSCFWSFGLLGPKDFQIIWLSCFSPLVYLVQKTFKLFGFLVLVLWFTWSKRLSNYLSFLFWSFDLLGPKDFQIIWLSCFWSFDLLGPKDFQIIWLSNLLACKKCHKICLIK
jgi:hypothetical protein